MDLVSTIRKEGSRGGVNFSWDDVQTSSHRENYLGHSLKAPVGRWQKGRDLSWYSKAGEEGHDDAEKKRKEEIRLIKEAEEDAFAAAMGLPMPDRNGGDGAAMGTGANNLGIGGEVRKMVGDVGVGEGEEKRRAFGEFVGKIGSGDVGEFLEGIQGAEEGGLVGVKNGDVRSKQRRKTERERDPKNARRRDRDGHREERREERRGKESSRDHREERGTREHDRDHRRHDRREKDRIRNDRKPRGRSQSPHTSRADERNRSRDRDQRGRSRSPGHHKRREYRERSREPVRRRSCSGETGGRKDERRRRDRNTEY